MNNPYKTTPDRAKRLRAKAEKLRTKAKAKGWVFLTYAEMDDSLRQLTRDVDAKGYPLHNDQVEARRK